MILRSLERKEEHATQRHERIRYAKRHQFGINPKTKLETAAVNYTEAYQLALELIKDGKLFVKATEDEQKHTITFW